MAKKWDAESTSSDKTLSLLSLFLFNKKEYTLKELEHEIKCSKQTILRQIDYLDTSGILQIEVSKRGRQNCYKIKLPTRTNIRFTPEEIQQLLFCRDFLLDMLPQKQKDLLSQASAKANLMTDEAQTTTNIAKTLAMGRIDYNNYDKILDTIIRAIHSYSVLEIEYVAKGKTEKKIHAFVPVRILVYHDGLYIRAWKTNEKGKVELQKPITFALHRIKEIWLTCRSISEKEFYKMPFPEEEKNKYFGMAMQTEPFEVQMKFYPPASNIIEEKIWSSDQVFTLEEDGSTLLTMSAQSELEVVKWVLGYGEEAELISPLHLREKVKKELQNSLNRY